jgi:hypothetical protein
VTEFKTSEVQQHLLQQHPYGPLALLEDLDAYPARGEADVIASRMLPHVSSRPVGAPSNLLSRCRHLPEGFGLSLVSCFSLAAFCSFKVSNESSQSLVCLLCQWALQDVPPHRTCLAVAVLRHLATQQLQSAAPVSPAPGAAAVYPYAAAPAFAAIPSSSSTPLLSNSGVSFSGMTLPPSLKGSTESNNGTLASSSGSALSASAVLNGTLERKRWQPPLQAVLHRFLARYPAPAAQRTSLDTLLLPSQRAALSRLVALYADLLQHEQVFSYDEYLRHLIVEAVLATPEHPVNISAVLITVPISVSCCLSFLLSLSCTFG